MALDFVLYRFVPDPTGCGGLRANETIVGDVMGDVRSSFHISSLVLNFSLLREETMTNRLILIKLKPLWLYRVVQFMVECF